MRTYLAVEPMLAFDRRCRSRLSLILGLYILDYGALTHLETYDRLCEMFTQLQAAYQAAILRKWRRFMGDKLMVIPELTSTLPATLPCDPHEDQFIRDSSPALGSSPEPALGSSSESSLEFSPLPSFLRSESKDIRYGNCIRGL